MIDRVLEAHGPAVDEVQGRAEESSVVENHNEAGADDAVSKEQLRLLYAQADVGLAINLVLCAVVVWGFWDTLSASASLTWLALVFMITGLRACSVRQYLRDAQREDNRSSWIRAYTMGAAGSGLSWGSGQWLLGPVVSQEYTFLYLFILSSLAAGAMPAMAHVRRVFLAYLFSMLVPIAVWFLTRGNDVSIAVGLMACAYIAALYVFANRYHRVSNANLTLAHHNRYLSQAARARAQAQAANAKLEIEISERREVARKLRLSESRFRDFADIGADLFWETDADLRYCFVSERYKDVMGVDPADVLGRSRREFMEGFVMDMHERIEHLKALEQRSAFSDLQFAWKRPDGKTVVILGSGKPVFDSDGRFQGYRGAARDVTESFTLSRKLAYQATHDPLTDLVNRHEFERRLRIALESAREKGCVHALAYLDLDQFKVVNDTCGHEAGDELLRQLSGILTQQVDTRGTFARLGGDEFGLLQEHTDEQGARQIAEKLRKAVEEFRFVWNDTYFTLGVSIGVSTITAASETVAQLQSIVDSACYTAKEQGRNRVHFCQVDDRNLTERQGEMQWAPRIARALEEDSFFLALQPIEPIQSRHEPQGAHFEVLIRMRAPDRDIPPGVFLPAAERYNLAPRLDRWVIAKMFSWLGENPERLNGIALCAINLSGTTLSDDGFADYVVRHLELHCVPANKVCFEITETAAIANLTAAAKFMHTVKALGCRFSLDDFGSGVSSFGYLRSLPVDFLKIDGLFVKDIVDDPIDRAMVKSINEIGQVMGKQTIAEFVENQDILMELRRLGVDYAQGFAIGKTIPLESFRPLCAPSEVETPAATAV